MIFAYEASGQGFGLYDELTAAGFECHVLAPTKIARSTQHRHRKTDEQDAEQILQLLRVTSWPATRCRRCGFRTCKLVTIESWCELAWMRPKKGCDQGADSRPVETQSPDAARAAEMRAGPKRRRLGCGW